MCLTWVSVAGVQRRGGSGGRGARGGERHRELSAQELQSFLLHGESSDLFLQPPVSTCSWCRDFSIPELDIKHTHTQNIRIKI